MTDLYPADIAQCPQCDVELDETPCDCGYDPGEPDYEALSEQYAEYALERWEHRR